MIANLYRPGQRGIHFLTLAGTLYYVKDTQVIAYEDDKPRPLASHFSTEENSQ